MIDQELLETTTAMVGDEIHEADDGRVRKSTF
jgi:hypothetical protein